MRTETCLLRGYTCTETVAHNRTACQPCLELAQAARGFLFALPAIAAARSRSDRSRRFADIARYGTRGD